MSQDHEKRAKLDKLADAIMQDIIATSDDEIIAEVGKDDVDRARALFIEVKQELSRKLLAKARTELEDWKSAQGAGRISFDRIEARTRFGKIRADDTDFNRKMTIAARNGEAPTESDIDGLIDDWAELHRLDGEDEPK